MCEWQHRKAVSRVRDCAENVPDDPARELPQCEEFHFKAFLGCRS